jgi:hypothetical protein
VEVVRQYADRACARVGIDAIIAPQFSDLAPVAGASFADSEFPPDLRTILATASPIDPIKEGVVRMRDKAPAKLDERNCTTLKTSAPKIQAKDANYPISSNFFLARDLRLPQHSAQGAAG